MICRITAVRVYRRLQLFLVCACCSAFCFFVMGRRFQEDLTSTDSVERASGEQVVWIFGSCGKTKAFWQSNKTGNRVIMTVTTQVGYECWRIWKKNKNPVTQFFFFIIAFQLILVHCCTSQWIFSIMLIIIVVMPNILLSDHRCQYNIYKPKTKRQTERNDFSWTSVFGSSAQHSWCLWLKKPQAAQRGFN